MKRTLLIAFALLIGLTSKAQYYKLKYDSVGIISPLKLGTVTTGNSTDSILVKRRDGRIFKLPQSLFINTAFTETDPNVSVYAKSLTAFSVIKTSTDALYEPLFAKNTAFNKNYGTTAGTVAQGNDSRILNGQTAFGWGNHATAGYGTGTVTTFSRTNGFGINATVTSPTTSPNINIAVDTTVIAYKVAGKIPTSALPDISLDTAQFEADVNGVISIKESLLDNAGGGGSNLDIQSGSYVPTIAISTGTVSSVTNLKTYYTKIGDIVTVAGTFQYVSSGTNARTFSMSLPFSVDIISDYDITGDAALASTGTNHGIVKGDVSANNAVVELGTLDGTILTRFRFTYSVNETALPNLLQSTISFGTSTATQNVVNWSAVTNATSYVLTRSSASNMSGATTLYTGPNLTFTDTGLTANTIYYYQVVASAINYTNSTSTIANKTTAVSGGGGAIPQAMFTGGGAFTYNSTTGTLTGTSGTEVRSVAARSTDTAPNSTLPIKSIEIGWDSSWTGKDVVFGLGSDTYGEGFNNINVAMYIPSSGNILIRKAKSSAGGVDTSTGYNLSASSPNSNFKFKVEVTAGTTFWEASWYRSIDGGANWIALTGLTSTTTTPITTPLYGQINNLGTLMVTNGIKITE